MCSQHRNANTNSVLPKRQFYGISSLQCSITCCFVTMGSSLWNEGMKQGPKTGQDLDEVFAKKTQDTAENVSNKTGNILQVSSGQAWQPTVQDQLCYEKKRLSSERMRYRIKRLCIIHLNQCSCDMYYITWLIWLLRCFACNCLNSL